MNHIAPLNEFFDSLVHASARLDPLAAARHRAYIVPRLLMGLFVLASLPVLLAVRQQLTPFDLLLFGSLTLPVAPAYILSITGRYKATCLVSTALMTALVTAVAFMTGGFWSFAVPWLVVVPIEAALSASRRVIVQTCVILAAGLAVLSLGHMTGLSTEIVAPRDPAMAAMGAISAVVYALGIAFATQWFQRAYTQRLRSEESRYRLFARNMTDVITCHDRSGAVTFASPAAESMFGALPHELHGHGLFDRVHVGDRPTFLTAICDAAELAQHHSVEFRVRRTVRNDADAGVPQYVWIEMRCRPLDPAAATPASPAGGGREVVAVMRDVSERKCHEQELQAARAEAERANSDKSRFLAVVSHELRTPLNAVIGFSEMMINEESMQLDRAKRAEYAMLINESGLHLLAVVNGILDMSKIEAGRFEITPEPFDPVTVIRGCCDLLALKARDSGVDVRIETAQDTCEIVADRRAFRQILLNLLANAIKFSPCGGQVSVRVQVRGADATITVEDQGIGIASADLPQIGRPFFQVASSYDRPYNGTGLGLSIVKGLIDLHGGRFEVDSRLQEGTRAIVHLPRHFQGAKEESGQADSSKVAALVRPLQAKKKLSADGAARPSNTLNSTAERMAQ